jgi:hypothetical protein
VAPQNLRSSDPPRPAPAPAAVATGSPPPADLAALRAQLLAALDEECKRATSPLTVLTSPDGFREGVRAAKAVVLRVLERIDAKG